MALQAWLLPTMAFVGALAAIVNYLRPDNGISGTGGALLVVGSSVLLAIVGWGVVQAHAGRWRVLLIVLAAILIAGTAFAAWLLEANILFGLMVIAGIGWLSAVRQVARRNP